MTDDQTAQPDSDPLLAKTKRWFEKQGYPLEFDTARSLRSRGMRAVQGSHYIDPATTKAREIDVVAWHEGKARHPFARAVLSCKKIGNPLVVMIGEHPGTELTDLSWFASRGDLSMVQGMLGNSPTRLFQMHESIGFSVVRALLESDPDGSGPQRQPVKRGQGEEQDLAYKFMSELASAVEGVRQGQLFADVGLVWPVLVIDGPLIRLVMDEEGNAVLKKMTMQRVLWNGSPDRQQPMLIDIVTKGVLDPWSREMANALRHLEDLYDMLYRAPGP